AEQLAGVESFYTAGNMHWPHLLDNSLKAHFLYKRDVSYVVEQGKVVIIDEFTGRKMEGRQWSDGLHQAVESKEGVTIKQESQTLATITLQNYFKLYKKLGGMTGTAMTEADEFLKIYGLDVLNIPTNQPMQRINEVDRIYRSQNEKWDAVVEEVRHVHDTGRPVLVGTVSIESSELLSRKLKRFGVQHNLLNAKFHEREAEIVAQAGRHNAVTISTNMAGRGTDIVLGGNPEHMAWDVLSKKFATRLDVPKSVWDDTTNEIAEKEGMRVEGETVATLGGLHVVGTERHDSRRIDLQLRGRAGRQGDPGSSRFFVSLDDDLMRIFMGPWVQNLLGQLGMEDGEAIENKMVNRQLENAQKKREEHHFEVRKHLLEYDEVMDEQRKRVYSQRQRILDGANCRELVIDMIDEQIVHWVHHFLDPIYRWNTIAAWAAQEMRLELEPHSLRDMSHEQLLAYLKDEALRQGEYQIEERLEENLPDDDDEINWNWISLSKWVNTTWGLNTSERELKKVGRSELQMYLYQRVCEAVDRFDFSPVEALVDEEWGTVSLSSWLHQQFTLLIEFKEFSRKEPDDCIALIRSRISNLYREKEIQFPVAVGLTRFMATEQGGGDRYDREGLTHWANGRFATSLELHEFRGISRSDIERDLLQRSETFLKQGDTVREIDERLDKPFGPQGSDDPERELVRDTSQLSGVVDWANAQFHVQLTVDRFEESSRDSAKQILLQAYDTRFRPELNQAERSVVLEILDTAWKEHLYFMDHLRQGVSLMSYAQKDPKVEYRREGTKAFADMWARVGQQVTATI
ncbi:MAG: preprotein translocase subunit SecA, partial [Planctomycetaceae bacterium]